MRTLIFLLLLTAGLGLMIGLKRKWRTETGRTIFLAADVMVILVLSGCWFLSGSGGGATLNDKSNEILKLSHLYIIGEAIGQQAEGKEIALVMSAELADSELKEKMVAALKVGTGIDADISVIGVEASRAGKIAPDAEVRPDWSTLVSAADYDRAMIACGKARIVIFASELPSNYGRMAIWRNNSNRPDIYLVNADQRFEEGVKRKLIAGITRLDPGADFSDLSIPFDYKAAFSKRYRFVTAAN